MFPDFLWECEKLVASVIREIDQFEVVLGVAADHIRQRPLRFSSSCCRRTSRRGILGPAERRRSSE